MPVLGPFESKFSGQSCMSCGEPILLGQKIYWLKGQGNWHEDCPTPRSIDMYVREEAKKRETR